MINEFECGRVLTRCETGRFVTIDDEGYPYPLPMHFVYAEGIIYVHGKSGGEKIANIERDNRVAFEVDENLGYHAKGDSPCNVGTYFNSVVVRGRAFMVTDEVQRRQVLTWLVYKYAPHLNAADMPDETIAKTVIIGITAERISGKKRERPQENIKPDTHCCGHEHSQHSRAGHQHCCCHDHDEAEHNPHSCSHK
ncbi:MAG: pyridoxamine 5'-phosphate oxidase family protein [Clostridia bacterium]|nr:pyridoxamine 5'-phosphate oxidase family protein [Clostridia bacterium]